MRVISAGSSSFIVVFHSSYSIITGGWPRRFFYHIFIEFSMTLFIWYIDSFSHLLIFLQGWIDIWHVLAIYRMFHSLLPSCVFPFFCWLSFNIAWVLKDMKITFNLFYTCQYYWVNVCGDFSIFKQPRALSKSAFYGWSSCGQLQKVFPHF